jgi:Protein of unknown function (DUF3373)
MSRLGFAAVVLAASASSAVAAPDDAEDETSDEASAETEPEAAAAEPAPAEAPVPVTESELLSRVEELEDIVQELERKAAVQKIGWSADYRVTLSSFKYKGESLDGSRNPDGTRKQIEVRNVEQWTHRVRLSMQADPIPQLRFRARLVAFKRFGDTSASPLVDGAQARLPRDAAARFDRFWIDWALTDDFRVSVGRVSTTDGSPAELRENMEHPAATISLGLVDSEYDAFVLTYQAGPLLLRGAYLAWQFQRDDDPFGAFPFLAKDENPVRVYAASVLLRPEDPGLPSFELTGYINPEFGQIYPVVFLGPDGAPLRPSKVPKSFGSLGAATALFLWRDIGKRLDVFASGSVSFADPNGQALEYPIGPDGASVPVFALVSSDRDKHLGYHAYVGGRLALPFGGTRAPKLGLEATYGSRYVTTFVTPTTDLVSRIGVRGRTYDAYVIQPIYPQLFARLSYTLLDYDYAPPVGGGLGPVAAFGGTAPPSQRQIQGVNLMLHADF